MAIRLQQLLYFVEVAEEGQMTRAAGSLHVAQPALSHAIAHLEAQLGVELLERHARGVSLTTAGERFFTKARVALAAAAAAELTARSLMRAARNGVELGFLGSPPMPDAPELLVALAQLRPGLEMTFRELRFPGSSSAGWLDRVDIALCFAPRENDEVEVQSLRLEPRSLLPAKSHPLAERDALGVGEVLDETFPGSGSAVDPEWVGLWQRDDHRGAVAPNLTSDRATNPHEMVAIVAAGRAVTAAGASDATNVARALPSGAAISLTDADPVALSLVWRRDNADPAVETIVKVARNLSFDQFEGQMRGAALAEDAIHAIDGAGANRY